MHVPSILHYPPFAIFISSAEYRRHRTLNLNRRVRQHPELAVTPRPRLSVISAIAAKMRSSSSALPFSVPSLCRARAGKKRCYLTAFRQPLITQQIQRFCAIITVPTQGVLP